MTRRAQDFHVSTSATNVRSHVFYPPLKHCCNFEAEAAQDSSLQSTETTGIRNATPAVAEGLLCAVAGSPSLLSNLILAVREGRSLLVEDIGTNIDPVLDPVLCHRTFFKVGASRSFSHQAEAVSTACHYTPTLGAHVIALRRYDDNVH